LQPFLAAGLATANAVVPALGAGTHWPLVHWGRARANANGSRGQAPGRRWCGIGRARGHRDMGGPTVG
jgi:hypothetical protein